MSADKEFNKFDLQDWIVVLDTISHLAWITGTDSLNRNDLEQRKFDSNGKIRIITDI